MEMKKSGQFIIKNWKPFIYLTLLLTTVMLLFSINFFFSAKNKGKIVGTSAGILAGTASGSLDGWTNGYHEGKEEGLTAKDTVVTLTSAFKNTGKLDLLYSDIFLSKYLTVGDSGKKDAKYKALYLYNGKIKFSLDLEKISVTQENGKVTFTLPLPEYSLIIDDSSVQKLKDYQQKFINGSSEDGFDAYKNARGEVIEQGIRAVSNYDDLHTTAKSIAENHIIKLANTVGLTKNQYQIEWGEEVG